MAVYVFGQRPLDRRRAVSACLCLSLVVCDSRTETVQSKHYSALRYFVIFCDVQAAD